MRPVAVAAVATALVVANAVAAEIPSADRKSGYDFMKTGECVSDRKLKLRKYKVVEKGDEVYVLT